LINSFEIVLLGQSSHSRSILHRWLNFTIRYFSLHRGFALHFCSYIIFNTAVLQICIALKFVEISLPLQSVDFVQVFQSTCHMTQYLLSSVPTLSFIDVGLMMVFSMWLWSSI